MPSVALTSAPRNWPWCVVRLYHADSVYPISTWVVCCKGTYADRQLARLGRLPRGFYVRAERCAQTFYPDRHEEVVAVVFPGDVARFFRDELPGDVAHVLADR